MPDSITISFFTNYEDSAPNEALKVGIETAKPWWPEPPWFENFSKS